MGFLERVVGRLVLRNAEKNAIEEAGQDTSETVKHGIDLVDINDVKDVDCLVLAVAHDAFKQMSWDDIDSLYGEFDNNEKVLIDVKSILDRKEIEEKGYSYWRL